MFDSLINIAQNLVNRIQNFISVLSNELDPFPTAIILGDALWGMKYGY